MNTLHKLVRVDSEHTVPPGTVLHCVSGPLAGQTWRYEDIRHSADGEPVGVHCTRPHRQLGLVHRDLPAHTLGCKVVAEVELNLHASFAVTARQAWSGFVTLVMAGIVAYVVAVGMQAMFHV